MIELLLSSAKGERHFEDFLCEQNILTIEPESVSISFARAGLTSEREIAGSIPGPGQVLRDGLKITEK